MRMFRNDFSLQKNKGFLLMFLLLTIVFFGVFYYIFDPKPFLGGDNATYYALAKSIASGQGYTNIHMSPSLPATHFPPGYPALLSIAMLFSKRMVVMKWFTGMFLLLSMYLFSNITFRFSNSKVFAFVLSVIVMLNYHVLQYASAMMSEIPFLCFSLATLYLLTKESYAQAWYRSKYFVGSLLAMTFCFYIRSQGVALVGGVVFYYLLEKKWKHAGASIVGFVVLTLPWQIRNRMLGSSSYLSQLVQKNPYRPEEGTIDLSEWFVRIYENAVRYLSKEIPNSFFPFLKLKSTVDPTWEIYLLGGVILLLVVCGLFFIGRYRNLLLGYLCGQFAIQLLWPQVWFGVRFMLPIFPILLFLAGYSIFYFSEFVASKIKNKKVATCLPVVGSLALLCLFAGFSKTTVHELHLMGQSRYNLTFQHYFGTAQWAKANLPADAVICTRKPGLFYLFADRKVCNFRNTNNAQDLIDDLEKKKVDYVVLDKLGYSSVGRYLLPAMKQFPRKFSIAFQTKEPKNYLWKFEPKLGYFGDFNEGKHHGYGVLHLKNGSRYEGNWNLGKREGAGIFYWANKQSWQGQWSDDKRNGMGVMRFPNGDFIRGEWKMGHPVGILDRYNKEGDRIGKMLADEFGKE